MILAKFGILILQGGIYFPPGDDDTPTKVEAAHMVATDTIGTVPEKWALRFGFKNDNPMEEDAEVTTSPATANGVTASLAAVDGVLNSAGATNEDPRPTTAAKYFAHDYLVFNKATITVSFFLWMVSISPPPPLRTGGLSESKV